MTRWTASVAVGLCLFAGSALATEISVTVDGQSYQCGTSQQPTVAIQQACIAVPFDNATCGNFYRNVQQGINLNTGAIVWQNNLGDYKGTPPNCSCAECTYPNPDAAHTACLTNIH